MKKIISLIIYLVVVLFVVNSAYAEKGGKPNDSLQQQIDELRLRVEALEQTPQGVKVYDGNENYLCDLISIHPVLCYIPSLESFIYIDRLSGLFVKEALIVYFETDDCQNSQPYVEEKHKSFIIQDGKGNFYKAVNVASQEKYFGYGQLSNGECSPAGHTRMVVPVEQIPPPFTFPIDLPFIFK